MEVDQDQQPSVGNTFATERPSSHGDGGHSSHPAAVGGGGSLMEGAFLSDDFSMFDMGSQDQGFAAADVTSNRGPLSGQGGFGLAAPAPAPAGVSVGDMVYGTVTGDIGNQASTVVSNIHPGFFGGNSQPMAPVPAPVSAMGYGTITGDPNNQDSTVVSNIHPGFSGGNSPPSAPVPFPVSGIGGNVLSTSDFTLDPMASAAPQNYLRTGQPSNIHGHSGADSYMPAWLPPTGQPSDRPAAPVADTGSGGLAGDFGGNQNPSNHSSNMQGFSENSRDDRFCAPAPTPNNSMAPFYNANIGRWVCPNPTCGKDYKYGSGLRKHLLAPYTRDRDLGNASSVMQGISDEGSESSKPQPGSGPEAPAPVTGMAEDMACFLNSQGLYACPNPTCKWSACKFSGDLRRHILKTHADQNLSNRPSSAQGLSEEGSKSEGSKGGGSEGEGSDGDGSDGEDSDGHDSGGDDGSGPPAPVVDMADMADMARFRNPQGRYVCPQCKKDYRYPSRLRRHLLGHAGIKQHKCPHPGCLKAYARKDGMLKHHALHHTDKSQLKSQLRCPQCKRVFRRESSLKQHVLDHSKGKLLECSHCGHGYTMRKQLTEHLRRSHKDEMPYKCLHPGCTKAYKIPSELAAHARIHDPIKLLKCPYTGCSHTSA